MPKLKYNKEMSLGLKGIAILLMLMHHNFGAVSLFEKYDVSFFPFPQNWIVNACDMGKICVSLFAFVSGYGLFLSCQNSKEDKTKWVMIRYIKTFSGYWMIWILSSIITELINGRFLRVFMSDNIWESMLEIAIDFFGFASLFGTASLNGTWWYMSAAFVFILITPLLTKYKENLWLILIGVIVFWRVIAFAAGINIFPGGKSIYAFLTPFILGTLFAKNNYIDKLINRKNKSIRFVIELILLLVSYKIYTGVHTEYFWELKWGAIPLVVILFCVEFVICIPGIKKILVFLGEHSANIYMTHTFIRAFYLMDFTYSWKYFLLITAVLLVICLIISMGVELLKKMIKYDTYINRLCMKVKGV